MPRGFSFSWKRALGISAAKARISRETGIPLTSSGRQRKIGRMGSDALASLLVEAGSRALKSNTRRTRRRAKADKELELSPATSAGNGCLAVMWFLLAPVAGLLAGAGWKSWVAFWLVTVGIWGIVALSVAVARAKPGSGE